MKLDTEQELTVNVTASANAFSRFKELFIGLAKPDTEVPEPISQGLFERENYKESPERYYTPIINNKIPQVHVLMLYFLRQYNP